MLLADRSLEGNAFKDKSESTSLCCIVMQTAQSQLEDRDW